MSFVKLLIVVIILHIAYIYIVHVGRHMINNCAALVPFLEYSVKNAKVATLLEHPVHNAGVALFEHPVHNAIFAHFFVNIPYTMQ